MADASGLTGHVRAAPARIAAALAAAEHYPEWQSGVLAADVLERDADGRVGLVALEVDAKVRRIRYTARYWYDLDATLHTGRLGFDLVRGDLKDISGSYTLAGRSDGTTEVTIDLVTDVGFYVPGPVKRRVRDQSLRSALRDLQRRVEH